MKLLVYNQAGKKILQVGLTEDVRRDIGLNGLQAVTASTDPSQEVTALAVMENGVEYAVYEGPFIYGVRIETGVGDVSGFTITQ